MQTARALCLHEATVSLALADADDYPATPLWAGAQPESARFGWEPVTVRLAATGAKFAARHVVDAEHRIQLDSLWLLKRAATATGNVTRYGELLSDHVPNETDRLVLTVEWQDGQTGQRYGRRYTGVKPAGYALESRDGIYEFGAALAFTAEDFEPLEYLTEDVLLLTEGPITLSDGDLLVGT
jgi:hypothetical protein